MAATGTKRPIPQLTDYHNNLEILSHRLLNQRKKVEALVEAMKHYTAALLKERNIRNEIAKKKKSRQSNQDRANSQQCLVFNKYFEERIAWIHDILAFNNLWMYHNLKRSDYSFSTLDTVAELDSVCSIS